MIPGMRAFTLELLTVLLLAMCCISVTGEVAGGSMPFCERLDGVVKVTGKLIDQFVRLDILRIDFKDVVDALVQILMSDNPLCERRYASVPQLQRLASALNFTELGADDLLSLARSGELERLSELAHSAAGTPMLVAEFREALAADPGNLEVELHLGRVLAFETGHGQVLSGANHIMAAISGLEDRAGGVMTAVTEPARLDVAMAFEYLGQHQEALAQYATLISADPMRLVLWHAVCKTLEAASSQHPSSQHPSLKHCKASSDRARRTFNRLHGHLSLPKEVLNEATLTPGIMSMRQILARYSELHATLRSSGSSASRRFLVYTPGSEGWGNRMLVLASVVLMAIKTQRELVIDWQGSLPLGEALEETYFPWHWDRSAAKPWGELERICNGEGMTWKLSDPEMTCGGKRNLESCSCGRASSTNHGPHAQWLFHRASSTLLLHNPVPFLAPGTRDLLGVGPEDVWSIPGIEPIKGGPRVVWYQGLGSFILAQAKLKSYAWAWKSCGIEHGAQVPMAACVLQEVVKAGTLVRNEMSRIYKEAGWNGGQMIGLALRRGNRGSDGAASVPDGQQKDSYSYLQASGELSFVACGISLMRHLVNSHEKIAVFLATDDPELYAEVQSVLPPRVGMMQYAGNRSVWMNMLVDWFMLGECHDAVLTEGSTFGLTAFMRSHPQGPWPVSVKQGDMKCHRRSQQTEFIPEWATKIQ